MKEYDVHRSEQCPTGQHVEIDPDTRAETTVNCTCPALVVRASGPPGPTEPHLMLWSRGELARLVTEMDRGYFDANGSPPRRSSMFVSAFQSELLNLIDRNPFAAVVTLFSRMSFDQVTFCFATYQLSFRMMPGQWAVLGLPDDDGADITYRLAGEPAGTSPAVLWERPTVDDQATGEYIRGQVRELLTGPGGWKPAVPGVGALQDDGDSMTEVVLAQLDEFAAQLDALPALPAAVVSPCEVVAGCPRPAVNGAACEVHKGGGGEVLPVEPAKARARGTRKPAANAPAAKKRLPTKARKDPK